LEGFGNVGKRVNVCYLLYPAWQQSEGITNAERNSNGKVVCKPTERVVSAFFVFRATNRDIPDQAIPNGAIIALSRDNMGFASASAADNWIHTYGETNKDRAENLIQTSDGGCVIVEEANATSSGRLEPWILKNDSQGSIQWNKTYGNPGMVMGSCVTQISDGGYAVAGTIQSTPQNPQDMTSYVWIGKLDSNVNPAMFIPEFPLIATATLIIAVLISFSVLAFKKRYSHRLDNDNVLSTSVHIARFFCFKF
jgi:hypothetical protein